MTNRILDQRYELEELVGGGGMADVYKATDRLLQRPVAVKILHEQFQRDQEFIEKFHREAQAAARLSHPNIVNIYDVGVSAGEHYIVMEYVPGTTLKELIQKRGHLEPDEALAITREIAEALAHAHANGLVHCDIKPHNILMLDGAHAKVADFGIARAVTESTRTYSGNGIGSVHYFSPEQAKGTVITPKSDVYSLGVVLYEMLTGELPFTGENPVSIAMKHLQDEPTPVRRIDPAIPPVVEALVARMMAKDPALRPESAELVHEIEQAEAMVKNGTDPGAPDPFATQVLPRVSDQNAPIPPRRAARAQRPSPYDPHPEHYEDDAPEEKKSLFHSKAFVLGLVMVLMLGFGVGAFLSFGKFWSTNEVVVPDVVGKQMTLARQILEDKKLRVNVAETYDADVPPGQVVSQTPEAGATVKEERLVTIYVSKGGEELTMPDLKGLTKSEAEAKLTKMGLKLGTVYEKNSDEEAGTVIQQDPNAGSKISKGQEVDLIVSKGKKAKKAAVPNVTGATLENAQNTITARGLKVGSVTKQQSSQTAGTVISQSVAGGTEADEGTSIDLVIAEPAQKKEEKAKTSEKDNAPKKDAATGKTK
ncbi:MAG: Stk1 family PASTA domain-containing Ser/Thr kinase [Selenomonas sp.]|uniref:Stk1 family PASTA domain-containing Ser/Thr kinase n=1 Tax=Selenomonas sp. TaxID=2053611 RepID=UPI0025FC039C|nr:Stk1 family PASTA domain-containing Ser/Thr kinase [Selenomonas sp.]MCI6086007.1 Stk1 family PASTA domain-containing Ser/Thr kinase [Selenomonas sp.]